MRSRNIAQWPGKHLFLGTLATTFLSTLAPEVNGDVNSKSGTASDTETAKPILLSEYRCADPEPVPQTRYDTRIPPTSNGTITPTLAISAKETKHRLILTMPKMPISRSYCVIDAEEWEDSVTVEWDPLQPRSLVRYATLHPRPDKETKYRIACHAEPARNSLRPSINFAWRFSNELCKLEPTQPTQTQQSTQTLQPSADYTILLCDDPGTEATPLLHCDQRTAHSGEAFGHLEIKLAELPELSSGDMSAAPALTRSSAQVPISGLRSYGPIPEQAINDLFQVVAEVAIERAQSKGMKLIQSRVKKIVCEETKFRYVLPNKEKLNLELERTCQALDNIRLQDLASSGKLLLNALTEDFLAVALQGIKDAPVSAIFRYSMDSLPVKTLTPSLAPNEDLLNHAIAAYVRPLDKAIEPIIEMAISIALDAIQGKTESVRGVGQRLVVALSRAVTQTQPSLNALVQEKQGLFSFAFAAIAECHKRGHCDAAEVERMIGSPGDYFRQTITNPVTIDHFLQYAAKDAIVYEIRAALSSGFSHAKVARAKLDLPAIVKIAGKLQSSDTKTIDDFNSESAKLLGELDEQLNSIHGNIAFAHAGHIAKLSQLLSDASKHLQNAEKVDLTALIDRLAKINTAGQAQADIDQFNRELESLRSLNTEMKAASTNYKTFLDDYFKYAKSRTPTGALQQLKDALAKWPGAASFINAGIKLLNPPAGTTESEQARAALTLLSEVLAAYGEQAIHAYQRVLKSPAAHASPLSDANITLLAQRYKLVLESLKDLLIAGIEQDAQHIIASGATLITQAFPPPEGGNEKHKRFLALASAVSSYLATYTATNGKQPSEADLAARKDARKAALNSLIDAQTERGSRKGNVAPIVSIGALPAIFYGRGFSLEQAASATGSGSGTDGTTTTQPVADGRLRVMPLSLPVSLAADWHFRCNWGIHAEFSPLNLGNYIVLQNNGTNTEVVPPSPADAISPAGTAGVTYLFDEEDAIIMLGLTAGYSYKLGNSDHTKIAENAEMYRGWYYGVVLGSYIPFFDLN